METHPQIFIGVPKICWPPINTWGLRNFFLGSPMKILGSLRSQSWGSLIVLQWSWFLSPDLIGSEICCESFTSWYQRIKTNMKVWQKVQRTGNKLVACTNCLSIFYTLSFLRPSTMSNSSIQSYVSYRLSRFSLTEMIEEIEPLFLYSDQGIDDIKRMFLLTSDTDEMEWVPACALLETYPTWNWLISVSLPGFQDWRHSTRILCSARTSLKTFLS